MNRLRAWPVITVAIVVLLLLPAVLFMGVALHRGMGLSGGLSALAEQYASERNNLVVISLLGLLPLLVIGLFLACRRMIRKTWNGAGHFALFGALPVVLVTVFVHLQYWPSYLPNRQLLGFPHGLEFVIGPFVFAPIGVVLGFVVAWAWRRAA